MSRLITSYNSLEPQDKLTADILVKFLGDGCWRFHETGPIPSTIDTPEGLQVRFAHMRAKPADVAKLSLAYQAEAPVPAIVVTSDGSQGTPRILVDGYGRSEGRLAACSVKHWPATIPQFILNVDPDRMDQITRNQLLMIGVSLNQRHGTTMTLRNVSEVLAIAVPDEDAISSATLAAMLNISPSTVQRVRDLRKAEARAEALNVPLQWQDREVNDTILVMLGQKDEKITHRVFKEVVDLTLKARLSSVELKILFKDLAGAYEEADKMGVLRRWKAENIDRYEGRAARPTVGRRLQLLLGHLDSIDPESMVERVNPRLFEGNLRRLEAGRDKFEQAIKAQRGVVQARGPVPLPTFE